MWGAISPRNPSAPTTDTAAAVSSTATKRRSSRARSTRDPSPEAMSSPRCSTLATPAHAMPTGMVKAAQGQIVSQCDQVTPVERADDPGQDAAGGVLVYQQDERSERPEDRAHHHSRQHHAHRVGLPISAPAQEIDKPAVQHAAHHRNGGHARRRGARRSDRTIAARATAPRRRPRPSVAPVRSGSASGLRVTACMIAPASASIAPPAPPPARAASAARARLCRLRRQPSAR